MPSGRTVVTVGGGGGILAAIVSLVLPYIQTFEGSRSIPYRDIGGVLTVCSGHTGADVVPNKYYTASQCAKLTTADIDKAAAGVLKYSPQLRYHSMQLAAAISFSYNVGVGGYEKSSVARDFNRGNYQTGCSDLLKYTYAGGKYSKGLANRRRQEYNICVSTLTPGGLKNVGDNSTSTTQ